jgi:hypothetical protein
LSSEQEKTFGREKRHRVFMIEKVESEQDGKNDTFLLNNPGILGLSKFVG